MPIYNPPWNATREERMRLKAHAAEIVRTRGTNRPLEPPFDFIVQPAAARFSLRGPQIGQTRQTRQATMPVIAKLLVGFSNAPQMPIAKT